MAGAVARQPVLAYRTRPVYAPVSPEQASLDRYREQIEPLRRLVTHRRPGRRSACSPAPRRPSQWQTCLLWRNGGRSASRTRSSTSTSASSSSPCRSCEFLRRVPHGGRRARRRSLRVVDALPVRRPAAAGRRGSGPPPRPACTCRCCSASSCSCGRWTTGSTATTWPPADSAADHGPAYTDVTRRAARQGDPGGHRGHLRGPVLSSRRSGAGRGGCRPSASALLLVCAIVIGGIYPAAGAAVPGAAERADTEAPYIQRNIDGDPDGVRARPTSRCTRTTPQTTATPGQLRDDAETVPGIRLLDPAIVCRRLPAARADPAVLRLPGHAWTSTATRSTAASATRVIAVRELNLAGIAPTSATGSTTTSSTRTASASSRRTATSAPPTATPVFYESDIPPSGALGELRAADLLRREVARLLDRRRPDGRAAARARLPRHQRAAGRQNNTYDGKGGVPIGLAGRKLLYAIKFQEQNILLSDARQRPTRRSSTTATPRERVQKVAPWLTLDGDPYPAVVDGRIVVDPRRLHDDRRATRTRSTTSLGDATPDSLTREPDQRRGARGRPDQLHPQLGQGDGRRVRRHGHALRRGTPQDPLLQGLDEGVPGHGQAAVGDLRRT